MVQVHAEDDTEEEKEEEERERRREALFGMGGDVLGVDTDAQNHYGLEAPKPFQNHTFSSVFVVFFSKNGVGPHPWGPRAPLPNPFLLKDHLKINENA